MVDDFDAEFENIFGVRDHQFRVTRHSNKNRVLIIRIGNTALAMHKVK